MRATIACFAVLLGMVAARIAWAQCTNPGSSVGFDQCQLHPNCECVSTVIPCPGGGWYTEYRVVLPCAGVSAPPTPPSPPPPPPPPPSPPHLSPQRRQECDRMNTWLSEERAFATAYLNDDLLEMARARGCSVGSYNTIVWVAAHPAAGTPLPADSCLAPRAGIDSGAPSATTSAGAGSGGSAPAVMRTDSATCKVKNYVAGCRWLRSQGLPQAACTIARDHELVHVQQCRSRPSSGGDLVEYREREVEAHRRTIAEIADWIDRMCK